jgi:hypothetical protein
VEGRRVAFRSVNRKAVVVQNTKRSVSDLSNAELEGEWHVETTPRNRGSACCDS